MTPEDWKQFRIASSCWICGQEYEEDETPPVRDHDHFTGVYRGSAHRECNLNCKKSFSIPVVFHNLSNYDAHFIIKDVMSKFPGDVYIIPDNKEKYIAFIKHVYNVKVRFTFIDSLRFLNCSLEKLAVDLDDNCKTILKSEFSNCEYFDFLTQKGIFYMIS